MRQHIYIIPFVMYWASFVRAGLFSTYSLLTPQQLVPHQVIVPHSFSHNSVEFVQPLFHARVEPQAVALAHPQVLETAQEESQLPNALTKSRKFYGNPYVANALAAESINFKKEEVTFDRPSERIDRQQIVKLIHNLDRVHNEPHH